MSEGLRLVVISIAELIADCSLVIGETKYQDNDISGLPGTFLEGESRAFYYPNLDDGDMQEEQLAKAKIKSILHSGFSAMTIYEWLDAHSDDFESVGCLLLNLLNEDDKEFSEDIRFSTTRIVILEWFEVLEKYRRQGLGRMLAKKILHSAAARGECVMIQPMLWDRNGNQPERLKKFWMGLDKSMIYNSEFNTMYTSIFNEE